ncbi:predicted protein [Postia placenta Mad-698-R]|nr:predicted protein [Postia placenta Mad-698-R]
MSAFRTTRRMRVRGRPSTESQASPRRPHQSARSTAATIRAATDFSFSSTSHVEDRQSCGRKPNTPQQPLGVLHHASSEHPVLSSDKFIRAFPSGYPDVLTATNRINAFLSHADQVGFFLHKGRFLQKMSVPRSQRHPGLLSSALIHAVYLWGVRFSLSPALLVYEPVFLSRTTQALTGSIAHMPAHNVTHTIQAEVLLAHYYFTSGRLQDAQFHRNAATSLALSCRLYQLRSLESPSVHLDAVHGMDFDLPPTNDPIEEGERIHAFWHVYILDKCWATGRHSTSRFDGSHGPRVDTPWPLAMQEYETNGALSGSWGLRTVGTFLSDAMQNPLEGSSAVALRAKAAVLFERATTLAARWSHNPNEEQFAASFVALDCVIDRFLGSLLPVEMSIDRDAALQLLLCHTLGRAATIQLHKNFKHMDGLTESKDVVASKAASAALDGVDFAQLAFVDPIFAILWSITARALINEMARLRALSIGGEHALYVRGEHHKVATSLTKVTNAMSIMYNPVCSRDRGTSHNIIIDNHEYGVHTEHNVQSDNGNRPRSPYKAISEQGLREAFFALSTDINDAKRINSTERLAKTTSWASAHWQVSGTYAHLPSESLSYAVTEDDDDMEDAVEREAQNGGGKNAVRRMVLRGTDLIKLGEKRRALFATGAEVAAGDQGCRFGSLARWRFLLADAFGEHDVSNLSDGRLALCELRSLPVPKTVSEPDKELGVSLGARRHLALKI